MKDHKGCIRAFSWHSQAYYARFDNKGRCVSAGGADTLDEIMVGMYGAIGGSTGEFAIRWTTVAGMPSPRLEAFDDSWSALAQFGDLLARMAEVDNQNITPAGMAEILLSLGIIDRTARKPS